MMCIRLIGENIMESALSEMTRFDFVKNNMVQIICIIFMDNIVVGDIVIWAHRSVI